MVRWFGREEPREGRWAAFALGNQAPPLPQHRRRLRWWGQALCLVVMRHHQESGLFCVLGKFITTPTPPLLLIPVFSWLKSHVVSGTAWNFALPSLGAI